MEVCKEELCESNEIHEDLLKIVDETLPEETELYDLAELFKVFGDSTRIRILFVLFEAEVCVCDLAEAHLKALGSMKAVPGVRAYNLGNGRGFSNLDVIEAVRQVTGLPVPVEDAPRRDGDPALLVASSDLARRELGWTPRVPELRDIVQSAWDWRQRHPEGYGTTH